MTLKLFVEFLLLSSCCYCANSVIVNCYYDSRFYYGFGSGIVDADTIKPALKHCTHLVYAFAKINPETLLLEPLIEYLDVSRGNYKNITELKYEFRGLKVLLSVGGTVDLGFKEKYFDSLKTRQQRTKFADNAVEFLKKHGFDGLDLAWQFPTIPPKIYKKPAQSFWNKVTNIFSISALVEDTVVDKEQKEHRDQFTNLISYMRPVFDEHFLMITVSALPNVDPKAYFNVATIRHYVDFVNLMAFDYYTPIRNPNWADHGSPLFSTHQERRVFENANFAVEHWLLEGMPKEKLVLVVPTFARAWKTVQEVSENDKPPFVAEFLYKSGLFRRHELCSMIDLKHPGKYFLSYDSMQDLAQKANYTKNRQLGGLGLYDLTFDDFNGTCSQDGEQFPVLKHLVQVLRADNWFF